MRFTDNVALVRKSPEETNEKLKQWRTMLQGKGPRINRSKTKAFV